MGESTVSLVEPCQFAQIGMRVRSRRGKGPDESLSVVVYQKSLLMKT